MHTAGITTHAANLQGAGAGPPDAGRRAGAGQAPVGRRSLVAYISAGFQQSLLLLLFLGLHSASKDMESFYVTSKLEDVEYSSAAFLLKPRSHIGLTDYRINKLTELCCVLLRVTAVWINIEVLRVVQSITAAERLYSSKWNSNL